MKKNNIIHFDLSKTVCLFLCIILFSSSLFAAPVNDECANATTLSSSTSCNNNQYNIKNATASGSIPVGCASGGTLYDIWFKFTATTNSHTVKISNRATNFTNPEVQLFGGSCGSLASLVCGATTITGTGLTIGNTYYIRVSNIGSSVTGQGTFDICVTNPPAVPSNDDCSAATALTVSSTCTNTSANMYYASSSSPAGACGGATASTTYDVWFRFQATATTQTVTLSNLGAKLSSASTYIEMLSGSCGSLTSLGCQTAATRQTITGLTIGTFYYVRVYVLLAPTASPSSDWNFNICIQQPPANDECAGAISLTPGLACSNTAGSLDLATVNATTPIGCFAAGNYFDVWYKFVASTIFHTITLSSLGSSFSAPRIQIYSGNCGALVSMSCASATTITQAGLTIGQTYYIRVANFNVNPSGTGSVANFNICVTSTGTPPSNDLCSGAISLSSSTTCSNISGTLLYATATSGLPACGNNGSSEVWYSFVAQTAFPTITLSSVGANLAAATPYIQIFSGSCGTLSSIACSTSPLKPGTGLTVGTTYFVRITTNTSMAPPTTGTWTFNICITNAIGAAVDYGKSYINVTNGTSGGTVKPGDVLEIRATLVVARGGSPLAVRAIDSIAYYDTLSAGKGFAFVPGSIALRTNEGKIYKSYTDAYDVTDAGWYTTGGAGTDTAIQINMGLNATYAARGKLRSNSRPSNFGNTCIIIATYRVTVNAAYDTKINFGGGAFRYRDTLTGNFFTISFPRDSLMVYQSPGICPNSVSATNVLGDESNGTFGAPSGSPVFPQNRGTSPNTNYAYLPFSSGSPNDYYYGVANNTSAAGTTVQTVAKPNAARVFNLWDISGDHTGAANPAKGNLPCNLSQPISSTNPCGYMMVINSAYRTDTAFQFNVAGACTDTYYEISAWFKNICYKCGCDSAGRSATTASYIPTAANDSAGVRPNIAIKINGTDYYTTGDILYQGLGGTQSGSDTLNSWVQRAFIFKTSSNQTNFTMTFRNNAPGGGGNDWAIDDISLKTCLPAFQMNPSNAPSYCKNGQVNMSVVVSSYYNTYTYYIWERSTDGGSSWDPAPELPGTQTFTYTNNGVNYVDTVMYPSILATSSINGYQYRIKTASSVANLASNSCSIANSNDVITITVLSSCDVLPAEILKFNVQLKDEHSVLNWSVKQEQNLLMYEIERSSDGKNFTKIGLVNAKGFNAQEEFYLFNDPTAVLGKIYYRLKLIGKDNNYKYSNILSVSLTKANVFELTNLVNPFEAKLSFQVLTYQNDLADLELLDASGRKVLSRKISLAKGINALTFDIPAHLQKGSYLLRVKANAGVVNKVIQKL
jgi:hypothetical protein